MTDNAITRRDRLALAGFVLRTKRFSQGKWVREFEQRWSDWQDTKYSVFVNSGSSANLLLVNAINNLHKKKTGKDTRWIAQVVTWPTNITPMIQLGLPLELVDIDLKTLGPDLDHFQELVELHKPTHFFVTHVIGFSAITQPLIDICKAHNITIVEDCCEAHGAYTPVPFRYDWSCDGYATISNVDKVGNTGIAGTFSFYYGHHITTIEGGMICTKDRALWHELILLRSHGLARELKPYDPAEYFQRVIYGTAYDVRSCVTPSFNFQNAGYNVRNTEIAAFLGCRQLKRLDKICRKRKDNYATFCRHIDFSKFNTPGDSFGSNFAIPIFPKLPIDRTRVVTLLEDLGIQHRPLISGNLFRQKFVRDNNPCKYRKDDNAEIIHERCVYIGNHQGVNGKMIKRLCVELNKL